MHHSLRQLQELLTIREVKGSLVLALRWGLCSEAHLMASLTFLSAVSLLFQYIRNAKLIWYKTKKEESSDKSKGLQKIDAFKN